MTIRTVTLTAVAALSLGMPAHAQETRTITVPLTEPGAAAPVQTGPGTIVVLNPDGTTSVETTGAEPALPIDADFGSRYACIAGHPRRSPGGRGTRRDPEPGASGRRHKRRRPVRHDGTGGQ